MAAPLSIIIPTRNSAGMLPRTLQALMEGVEAGMIRELIIADGGSEDATVKIAESAGAEVLIGEPSRGGQLRQGAAAARAEWLLFLHSDTLLDSGWTVAVGRAIERGEGGYFWLRFRAAGVMPALVARWANLRSRIFKLPYGDQGLLVRRADYEAVGGYEEIPLMEDVALVRQLALFPLGHIARTGADRYEQGGWIRRGARNLVTLLRYLAGAKPEKLAARYAQR